MSDDMQLYKRRCNKFPPEGITVTRATVETVLALATAAGPAVTIAGDLETGLSITIPAGRPWEVELAGTVERTFTYKPLPPGQHRVPDVDA